VTLLQEVGLEDRLLRQISRENEALQLLTGYVTLIDDRQKLATAELHQAVVNHMYDLVAAVLGATRDAAEAAHGRGVPRRACIRSKKEILGSLNRDTCRSPMTRFEQAVS
jgi:hypothetical protein